MDETDGRDYLREELEKRARAAEYDRFRILMRHRQRDFRRRVVALFLAISSIGLAVYFYFFKEYEAFQIPLMVAFGAAFSGFALYYLQPSSLSTLGALSDVDNPMRLRFYVDQRVAEAIDELKTKMGAKPPEYTDEDKAKVLSSIQARLESEAIENYVEGIRELVRSQTKDESLEERFLRTRRRLGQEVQDLAKRGNLNLILGILTTVAGLSVLGYAVFNPPSTLAAPELLAYFVPRVSLVILIEVFAYFFLRLYKQSRRCQP